MDMLDVLGAVLMTYNVMTMIVIHLIVVARKVGGIWFARIGRVQFSMCVVKRREVTHD